MGPVMGFDRLDGRTATRPEYDFHDIPGGTVPDIAVRSRCSERGIRILCDYLTVIGFLTKNAGAYGLTDYCATKWAVIGFARSLAKEVDCPQERILEFRRLFHS